jgi:hypothetical protein
MNPTHYQTAERTLKALNARLMDVATHLKTLGDRVTANPATGMAALSGAAGLASILDCVDGALADIAREKRALPGDAQLRAVTTLEAARVEALAARIRELEARAAGYKREVEKVLALMEGLDAMAG